MIAAYGLAGAVFFILLEWFLTRKGEEQTVYRLDNTVSNISIGICERLIYLLMIPVFTSLFEYLYDHFRLLEIRNTWYNWILVLLCTDFVWYWYHRLGHRVNLFWAAHIVHHQSADFNLSVAARITIFQAYIRTLFWCLLPLLGFPVEMVLTVLVIHGGYSFFTHTQLFRNTRLLEYVFITPSLHRVHHASNERYLDKNYGDIFVFWDKLFGTFQAEDEQPVYGLTKPLESHSFLWQHFHYYVELFYLARTRKGWKAKIAVFFQPPEKMEEHIREQVEHIFLRKNRKILSKRLRRYAVVQLAITLLLVIAVTTWFAVCDTGLKLELFLFSFLTLVNIGAVIEQKRYVFELEVARLFQLQLFLLYWLDLPVVLYLLPLATGCLPMIDPVRNYFLRHFYPSRPSAGSSVLNR